MSHVNKSEFLVILKSEINEAKDFATELIELDAEALNHRLTDEKWSVLECFQHMNLSTEVYLDQYLMILPKQKPEKEMSSVKLGWVANWLIKSMKPKDEEIRYKMKTFSKLNPKSELGKSALERFIYISNQLLEIVESAKKLNLNAFKVTSAIGPMLKLRFGESLAFVVAHNARHVLQAKNTLEKASSINVAK